ncbi:MAG: hypothetical protein V1655_04040 [bacterium]
MSWLIVAILSYFLFSFVALTDKFLLSGPPNSKIYTFYAGTLGSLIIILIPFVGLSFLDLPKTIFTLATGVFFVFSLFFIYEGLKKYEASRIVPAIGGITPIFAFFITLIMSQGKETLPIKGLAALLLLTLGSIAISLDFSKKISYASLKISAIASLFLALYFVFAKYVYLMFPFWHGLIWIKIGSLIAALFFLFSREVRQEIFKKREKKSSFTKKTGALFIINQGFGATAAILQNWAIALAGVSFVSVVIALQGVQYLFLFFLALLLSWKFPEILKEETSKKIIMQKIISILLICVGLAMLAI